VTVKAAALPTAYGADSRSASYGADDPALRILTRTETVPGVAGIHVHVDAALQSRATASPIKNW
jgi:hypothetical protein